VSADMLPCLDLGESTHVRQKSHTRFRDTAAAVDAGSSRLWRAKEFMAKALLGWQLLLAVAARASRTPPQGSGSSTRLENVRMMAAFM
jgi:hypothetical protein